MAEATRFFYKAKGEGTGGKITINGVTYWTGAYIYWRLDCSVELVSPLRGISAGTGSVAWENGTGA